MIIDYTINPVNRKLLCSKIESLDPTKLWQCQIRLKKSKRSIDQNSRLWGYLYKTLSEFLGLEDDEVHQLMGYKFLRYQKEIDGKTQEFIKSTTKLDTKEMADYQDKIGRWASEIGCYIE